MTSQATILPLTVSLKHADRNNDRGKLAGKKATTGGVEESAALRCLRVPSV